MKLKELTQEMAAALGMPESEAYSYARALRADDLVTTGPRGTGAPDMTPQDVLNLFIAIAGASVAKEASGVLDERRAYLAAMHDAHSAYRAAVHMDSLSRDAPDFAPRDGDSLVDALERLLDAAADGALRNWFGLPAPNERDLTVLAQSPGAMFEVTFIRRLFAVQVVALRVARDESGSWPDAGGIWYFAVPFSRAKDTIRPKRPKDLPDDLIAAGRLDLETFERVAALWRSRRQR